MTYVDHTDNVSWIQGAHIKSRVEKLTYIITAMLQGNERLTQEKHPQATGSVHLECNVVPETLREYAPRKLKEN